MKITIPRANWHMALADAIEKAAPGDTILCHEEAMAELGRIAQSRMCPDKQLTFEIERCLDLFTIYERPTDFPNHFVVRRSIICMGVVSPVVDVYLAPTLEQARQLVPPHLVRIPRFPDDEPQIVEVWL